LGLLGSGRMGGKMAANLIKGGHPLWVYDINTAAVERLTALGAKACSSSREASAGRDAVIMSLPVPAVIEQVVLGPEGVLSASPAPRILIDMSTSLPALTKQISTMAAEKGCQLLDAPVSGRPEGAANATLGIMVGGPEKAFEQALPLLRLLGSSVHHTGEVGTGHAMKLVNNSITGVTTNVIGEALMMGTLAGIDPQVMYEVLSASSANSRSLQNVLPRVLKGDYDPGFTIDLMHKDLDLAAKLGQEMGVPMPAVNLAKQSYQLARVLGLGQKDTSGMALMMEQLLGRKMREKVTE